MIYRQGDILLRAMAAPAGATVKQTGEIVLALGETTGHAHKLQCATLLVKGSESFVQLEQPTQLTHEEHGVIQVPAGNYAVTRQREYSPQEIRRVMD